MTMEVRNLLSRAMLDTSGCGSGNSTPKRPNPVVILTPPPHKLRDLSRPVDTSSQVSTPNDVKMAEASLEEVPTTISPIAVTPESRSITPPADVGQLQEKANKALEELLATKLSIDAHRQKVVWELSMELHWKDSEMVESIKEARAVCTHATLDAEALCSTAIKEAKAAPAPTPSGKLKPLALQPSGMLRPGEPPRLTHSTGDMPKPSNTWRNKSSKRKVRVRLTFSPPVKLPSQASPVELRGTLVASYHILMGQAPMSHPFTLSQEASPIEQPSAPAAPSSLAPEHSPRPKRQHPSPGPVDDTPLGETTSKTTLEGPPAPSSKRFPLGTRYSNGATQKHSAGTPV